jgi:hypothetical protein
MRPFQECKHALSCLGFICRHSKLTFLKIYKKCNFFTSRDLSPIRQSQDTKNIRSILRTSILRLFLGPLVVWPKVGENKELLRISKE